MRVNEVGEGEGGVRGCTRIDGGKGVRLLLERLLRLLLRSEPLGLGLGLGLGVGHAELVGCLCRSAGPLALLLELLVLLLELPVLLLLLLVLLLELLVLLLELLVLLLVLLVLLLQLLDLLLLLQQLLVLPLLLQLLCGMRGIRLLEPRACVRQDAVRVVSRLIPHA